MPTSWCLAVALGGFRMERHKSVQAQPNSWKLWRRALTFWTAPAETRALGMETKGFMTGELQVHSWCLSEKHIERIPMDSNGAYSAQLLTVAEIAQTLKVPVSWVYERTRRRGFERMPHIKLGKYLRFDPDMVSEWLKSMRE